ncbi:MAG: trigger factor [Betaproteobacteria bacterium]|nr:trigger factor [Betaproteobacteria bacterium]
MQANLESIGLLERRLSVTVPVAEIDGEVENRLKRMSRTVKMHGFRPGKVPLKVVAQQYASQVRQEVIGDTLERSFGDAVRQQNLKVAGYPRFEAKPLTEGALEFEYSATFEVYPEVAPGDLSQVKIVRPLLTPGEAEVDRTLDIMRRQRASFEAVDRAAENGDRLTLDYKGTIDGNEFAGSSAQASAVLLGEGRLLPDFERQLAGMKGGESKAFELRFPDDYHGREVAGRDARFEVAVKEVAAARLPEIDAEFARKLGVADGDLTKMRQEVRENLEREVRMRLKNRVKDQVMQALLDVTRLEAPKSLVEAEIQRLQALARQDLAARGVAVKNDIPIPGQMFEQQARRRVGLGLILGEVVKANALYAKPEQVRAVVEEQAQSYEKPEEVVKWFYASPERLREIESGVVEENVVAWVLGRAQVEDKPVDFDELMGHRK